MLKKLLLITGILLTLGGTAMSKEKEIVLAGGCFWCVESDIEKLDGVTEVISGYSGGEEKNATYKKVASGETKHRESVLVKYDDSKVSLEKILNKFYRTINIEDSKGQFVDRGFQYSPAVYYNDDTEKKLAGKILEDIVKEKKLDVIGVVIEPYKNFYEAEDYHQDYYKKNPIRYKYYRNGSGRDQYLKKIWGGK